MIQCSKPGCSGGGTVLLSYDYAQRTATLEPWSAGPPSPHIYVMCGACADRLRPPLGWELVDDRMPAPVPG